MKKILNMKKIKIKKYVCFLIKTYDLYETNFYKIIIMIIIIFYFIFLIS